MSSPGPNYWRDFWNEHARSSRGESPQKQVLRTHNKQPVEPAIFEQMLSLLDSHLRVAPTDTVLDLCCGNGLITEHLASQAHRVVAVDFAEALVSEIEARVHNNVTTAVKDIREVRFEPASFDKVVLFAGLQYLTLAEAASVVIAIRGWLREGGVCYLGDIPDASRMWHFFDRPEREAAYFSGLASGHPIIGTWFDPTWLEKLGRYAGFVEVEQVDHPAGFPYAYFRYDCVLRT